MTGITVYAGALLAVTGHAPAHRKFGLSLEAMHLAHLPVTG
jgi:hypothetical protein